MSSEVTNESDEQTEDQIAKENKRNLKTDKEEEEVKGENSLKENSKKENRKSIYTRRIIDISILNKILSPTSSHGKCGGHNLGNTCFMNSSIACLSNCTELTTYFLSKEYEKDLNKENPRGLQGKLAKEWYKLLYEYWVENNRVGNPSSFKNTIARKAHIFKGFGQQDSNEFMTFFLDYINEDLNKENTVPYEEIEEQRDNESDLDCAKRFWDLHIRRNNSIITDLFSGQYKSTIECPDCHWISKTYDPFNTLILPIPNRHYGKKNLKKNFTLYYIPKFSIRSTVKINAYLNENIIINDVAKELNEIEDFNYDVKNLTFIEVSDKKCVRICNGEDKLFEQSNYLFCSENDEVYKNIFMLYITTENERDLSAYPRIFYADEKMSSNELKMRIYFYARHYINNPFGKNEEEDEFIKLYKEYTKNENIKEYEIINYMTEEYKKIFENPSEESKELIDSFLKDLPFQILIVGNSKKVINLLKDNIEEKLKEFEFISESESEVGKLLDFMTKNKYNFMLKFNQRSSFIDRYLLKFNTCSTVKMKGYEENQFRSFTCDLQDCLEFFRLEETLEKGNEWYCRKCKDFKKAKKKMELFYLPKLFIVCLKRFSNSESRYYYLSSYYNRWEKNNAYVDFPINDMDMKEYVTGPDKDNSVYDLFAVSQHYGGTGGGHYTAVCKNVDGNWYNYNDSSVSQTSESDVVSSAAYVLFYRRKTD